MQATADSLAFTPPREPAAIEGFVLAVIAHLLLILALTWGINWDRDSSQAAVEAELWSALPQEAAPPPAPPPPPQVVQAPPVVQPPPQPVQKAPDITVERERQRKELEAKRRVEEEEKRKQLEAQRRKEEQQQKLAEEKKQREEQARKEKQREEKLRKEQEARLAKLREENLQRMLAEAAGTGKPSAAGTAPRATGGPSAAWGPRIIARVRPNILVPGDVSGNPRAEVEVRLAPDGTIVATKLTKSSGNPAWDRAVLRALELTGTFPRDADGRVHSPVTLGFSRHD